MTQVNQGLKRIEMCFFLMGKSGVMWQALLHKVSRDPSSLTSILRELPLFLGSQVSHPHQNMHTSLPPNTHGLHLPAEEAGCLYTQMKIGGDGEEYLLLLREEKIDIGDITSGHCHIDPHVLLLLFYFLVYCFFFRESLLLITFGF